MADDSPVDLKKLWVQEERLKQKTEKINKARKEASHASGDVYSEVSSEEVAAQTDWEKLIETAKLKFPEHLAAKFNITPAQRTAAIASSIGWTYAKIAQASGYSPSTVTKWFQKEPVKEFLSAFEYHTGKKDTKEMIDSEQYASLQVLKELRDDTKVSASTRKEIAMWIFEQKHGKAKESREIKGINLRDLTEAVRKTHTDILDEFETTTVPKDATKVN